jgi:phage baseplate assembly protein gpV
VSSDLCSGATRDRPASCGSACRLGIVKEQDLTLGRLRVVFTEFDQMLSYWLPLVVPKTQNDKAYWMPDIGEQVVCLMDEHDEDGVVLGAIYSQPDSTPVQSADKCHLGFKDGTTIEYDRAAHVLGLNFNDMSTIRYDGGVHTLSFSFEDQSVIKYDSAVHALQMNFSDGTAIKYDAAAHVFSIVGCDGASVVINAPVGISLQSGNSYVNVAPGGVTINPPLQ